MRNALLAAVVITGCALTARTGAAGANIFAGDSPAILTMTAPFSDLFTRAKSETDYQVKGQLTWSDGSPSPVTLDGVIFSERGHTSRQTSECAFPKLKVDLSATRRSGTPLDGVKTFKLGTHCGERGDDELTPRYGRLANQRAPAREAMVYRMLHAADIPTLLARPARVTYVNTDAPDQEPLTRFALLLEDDDEAQARLGASGQIDEDGFGSARETFDLDDTARLAFAQAMVGNFDWCVRMFRGDIYRCDERHPLWNVLAFERRNRKAIPLPYDFDLSGPVVGRHIWFGQAFSADYAQPPSDVSVEVQAQVQRTRSLFERSVLDETRAYFLAVRSKILEAIDRSSADSRGQELARQYVDAFYDAIHGRQVLRPCRGRERPSGVPRGRRFATGMRRPKRRPRGHPGQRAQRGRWSARARACPRCVVGMDRTKSVRCCAQAASLDSKSGHRDRLPALESKRGRQPCHPVEVASRA